jgi:hypothetical protein
MSMKVSPYNMMTEYMPILLNKIAEHFVRPSTINKQGWIPAGHRRFFKQKGLIIIV